MTAARKDISGFKRQKSFYKYLEFHDISMIGKNKER